MTVSLDCVNIHSLGHPLVLKIFSYLHYEDMIEFMKVFPDYLDDDYFKTLFTYNGQPIVAWEKTGKAFLLRLIPRRKYSFLLRRAALKFDKEKVLALLRRKANPEALAIPLKRFVRLLNLEAAQWLVKICPDLSDVKVNSRTAEFRPEVQLVNAAEAGNLQVVNALLIDGADLETKNDKGETALFKAVSNDKVEVTKHLIEEGADVNAKDKNGRSMFQEANPEIAKILIEAGLFVNSGDSEGLLLEETCEECARLLIDAGADLFERDCEDATAAKLAAVDDDAELARILIEAGSSKALPFTRTGLHGSLNTARVLLAAGVDPNIKDEDGCTALVDAARCNHMETVQLLLEAGADPNLADIEGKTALHYALSEEIVDDSILIVGLLIQSGANVHAKDNRGRSALMLAFDYGELRAARLLINAGATINIREKSVKALVKETAGDTEVFDLLLLADSNKKARRDSPNKTLLLVSAIKTGDVVSVKNLIKDGCDLNAQSKDGRSIIREAVRLGQTEIVRLLLEAGVEPVDDISFSDRSLVELAVSRRSFGIAQMLVEAGAHADFSLKDDK